MVEHRAGVRRVSVQRRFSDLDPLGHVNNVAFHDYLQEARVGLQMDLRLIHGGGFDQVVVKQEIAHRKPLSYSLEPVIVEIWVSRLGNSSYTLGYRILDERGDLAAEASTVMAVVDPATGRPVRMSDELRGILESARFATPTPPPQT